MQYNLPYPDSYKGIEEEDQDRFHREAWEDEADWNSREQKRTF